MKKVDKNITIYLSHPYYYQKEGKVIEQKLIKLGFKVVNPFDYESREYYGTIKEARKIVNKDLELISKSDIIVALVPFPTVGVSMEIRIAYAEFNKPVYVLTTFSQKLHPWLKVHSTKMFTSERSLFRSLKKLLK